jgi:hypothetical protein
MVVVFVRDLVIRDQRHEVDSVQALHALETFKAASSLQVIVGNDHDLCDEFARNEALANLLHQCFLARGVKDRGRRRV